MAKENPYGESMGSQTAYTAAEAGTMTGAMLRYVHNLINFKNGRLGENPKKVMEDEAHLLARDVPEDIRKKFKGSISILEEEIVGEPLNVIY